MAGYSLLVMSKLSPYPAMFSDDDDEGDEGVLKHVTSPGMMAFLIGLDVLTLNTIQGYPRPLGRMTWRALDIKEIAIEGPGFRL